MKLKNSKRKIFKRCKFKLKKVSKKSGLKLLNLHKDELLECFLENGAKVHYKSDSAILHTTTQTSMTIPPTRFTVDFNDGFANIAILK